jgi:hypothetical protein
MTLTPGAMLSSMISPASTPNVAEDWGFASGSEIVRRTLFLRAAAPYGRHTRRDQLD